MKKDHQKSSRRRATGSALIITLFVMAILSFSITLLLNYVGSLHAINERQVAREKAALAAEAGLSAALHYFEVPGDLAGIDPAGYAGRIDAFFTKLDQLALIEQDASLHARNYVWSSADGQDGLNPPLHLMDIVSSSNNPDLIKLHPAQVVELYVTPRRAGGDSRAIFTFWCKAQATLKNGQTVERSAHMDVDFNPAPRLSSQAGIVTGGSASVDGHFNLFWGECWSKGSCGLKLNFVYDRLNGYPYWRAHSDRNQVVDQWTKYMSATGYITDDNGVSIIPSQALAYCDLGAYFVPKGLWNDPWVEDPHSPKYFNALFQNVDLLRISAGQTTLSAQIDASLNQYAATGNPNCGYLFWKNIAIRRDSYFRVAADGAVYSGTGRRLYQGTDGTINDIGVGTPLTADLALTYWRTNPNLYVVFFDTKDGNEPNAYAPPDTRSNWADIKITGGVGDNCTRGLLYVAGNLYIGGAGTGDQDYMMKDPAGNYHTVYQGNLGVFHNGIIFSWGNFTYQGNAVVYGAVVTKGNYDAGGVPNVYYNSSLFNGEPFPMSTRANVLATVIPSGIY